MDPHCILDFTGNWDSNAGIWELDDGLALNKWYHIAYTLSDPEKRLDIYLDGEWAGFYCIEKVKTHKAIFNDGPLHIGRAIRHNGFNGKISNVRYFNWRLSPEENESQRKLIVYGSKITLITSSTGKYLSTKGVKYDFGPQITNNICDQEIDSENDVWTLAETNGKGINEGDPVSLNNIIGFKHKSTGYCLHSHNTNNGKVTPISKQQQGIV
ncbi:hypothetical protein RhiirA5_429416 [Rhizophagus irregularis]|uniref:Concanavalin A-like lectin/glucanase n=1 Tax=Rhizophagus irregularis TaxID=588596 RepID=A0A2N0NYF6_9GLOM|nr:hypothetical protein RhiirA5_429416 [Rhizophagus irregularis]